MNNEFIPYEQALDLKELGFNQECLAFYNSTFRTPNELLYPQYGGEVGNWNVENHLISAPLYQQAFRWFRDKKILGKVRPIDDWNMWGFKISAEDLMSPFFLAYSSTKEYATYQEAELECIKTMIKIFKTD
jgi:hypothetical protein